MSRAFAADTKVPVAQSRGELEKLLERYGADAFAYGQDGARESVAFRMQGRQFRFSMVMPDKGDRQFTHTASSRRSDADALKVWQQVQRQRWRALLLVIKAKLEAVSSGITTLEDEFLAHTVLPSGATVAEWIKADLDNAYLSGAMPAQLQLAGPTS